MISQPSGEISESRGHDAVVLVVEDDQRTRSLFSRWLTSDGYTTYEAATAAEASAVAATTSVAVAVCDVGLGPGEDGLHLAGSYLRSRPDMAVVFATGLAQLPPASTLQKGVVGYIRKPVQKDELLAAVGEGLNLCRDNRTRLNLSSQHAAFATRVQNQLAKQLRHATNPESLVTQLFSAPMRVHAESVARLAVAIAQRVGLSRLESAQTESAALMHEIGKLAMPTGMLADTGPVSRSDLQWLRRYTSVGAGILQRAGLVDRARVIIALGERWDGMGYPSGLTGDAIPVESRVLAVADTYDTIARGSMFRQPRGPADAILEVMRSSDFQFDPEVVDGLVAVVNDSFKLENGIAP